MYVQPFWSFETLPGGLVRLENSITREQMVGETATIDQLQSIYDTGDRPVFVSDRMLDRLTSLRIVFPDAEAADRWLDEREAAATLAQPTVDQIELTNRCPYSCKMCPRTSSMKRGLGDMDMALFERIIEQIAGRQTYVGLHHFGESLLYRNLASAVRLAKSAGLATGLSCNPPSLKPAVAKRLLDAGIAELVLSLDSLDSATYRSIRGPAADIVRARRNVVELVRLREAIDAETKITLQLISMRENEHEAAKFLAFCEEVGVDRGVVIKLGRWDFSDEKVATLGDFTSPLHGDYCLRPMQSVVVLWDGRVVPCCHDYDGLEVIGDLRTQTLQEIWESSRARGFRTGWKDSDLCRNCAFSRTFREDRRAEMGLKAFHRVATKGPRLEYLSPGMAEAERHFDGFDVAQA